MKLSENTLAVLKSFSNINPSMVLKPGKIQSTISENSDIYAEAELAEEFPLIFGIYEISKFISNIGQLGGPEVELDFDNNRVAMKSLDGYLMLFFGCEPELIKHPTKKLQEFEVDFNFQLTNETFSSMKKIAALNNFSHIIISGDRKGMFISAAGIEELGKGNAIKNKATYRIADNTSGKDFEVVFSINHLKLLPLNYNVEIVLAGFAKFISADGKLKYVIPLLRK